MKKALAAILAMVLLASAFMVPVSSEEGYEGMSVVEVEALAFETQPTFDGAITAEEWGDFTVEANGADAAGIDAVTNNYANSLFRWDFGDGISSQLSYKLWFRWDAAYFYVGAQVKDPDGYSNQNNRESIWNGDCLQFRVDPVGPNGIMTMNDESYDYKTEAFNYNKHQVPWSEPSALMNVGCAVYPESKRPYQVYDMARKLLTNGDRADVETLSLVCITPASEENGGVTTYEVAFPWELIFVFDYDPFVPVDPQVNTSWQIYTGKVLGVSATVLNAAAGSKSYNSFLAWGSGCCGAQHDREGAHFPYVNGGSNAVILSNKNAVDTSKTVSSVPSQSTDGPVETYVQKAIYANSSTDGYYFGINYAHPKEGAVVEMDVAPLGMNTQDEAASTFGYVFGNSGAGGFYSLFAGYDMSTKTFAVSENCWQNGMKDETKILARSEKTYDWAIADPGSGVAAEWHRFGISVDNTANTLTLYLDGEAVLEWTDPRVHNYDDSLEESDPEGAKKEIIPYGTVERVMDNLFYGTADYKVGVSPRTESNTILDFTFDSTDRGFQKSRTYRNLQNGFKQAEVKCFDSESEYGYFGHNVNRFVSATEETVRFGCFYCEDASAERTENNGGRFPSDGTEPVPPTEDAVPGDANGDGKVNMKDAIAICKHVADWADAVADMAAADINADGKVTVKDVAAILKNIAES